LYFKVIPNILDNNFDFVLSKELSNLNLISETKIPGVPSGTSIVFGRVIKDHKVIGYIKKNKFIPSDSAKIVGDISNKGINNNIKEIFKNLKKDVSDIVDNFAVSKQHVTTALSEPKTFETLKHFGFSLKAAGKALHDSLGIIHTAGLRTIEQLDKAGKLDSLKKGTEKVDTFFNNHPVIKKVAGPLVAGALLYQWQNMSFSGNFNDDFDINTLLDATRGDFSISNLVSSPGGIKALTQLIIGITPGLSFSFPWDLGIEAAFIYTGLKNAGNNLAAKDILEKLNNLKRT
jgi:hypothetical protein